MKPYTNRGNDKANQSMNIAILPVVALVFIILKMTGVIDWSWWIVLSPLVFHAAAIAMFVLAVALCLVAGAFYLVGVMMNWGVRKLLGTAPLDADWPKNPKEKS